MSLVHRTVIPVWPRRVLPADHDWPLFDTAGSRRLEARAPAALPPGTLMRRAGLALARWALARYPHARTVWVAAGPGGNGGDGLYVAAELASTGRAVTVSLLADPARLGPDAAEGLARARAAGVRVIAGLESPDAELSIDALLGLGASRPPAGPIRDAVRRLNASAAPTLAVDLPTGLASDTGARLGDVAVRAHSTLALLSLKPGLFTGQGRTLCGDIAFDPLGVEPQADDVPAARLLSADPDAAAGVARSHDTHKGSYGDVLVIGGGIGMHGAARLAAHAALASGAGRTFVSLLDPAVPPGDLTRPEWLWQTEAWTDATRRRASTVVCGCGGGPAVRAVLPALLADVPRLVLDADALNALAADPALQAELAARGGRGRITALTPHPLEAARLLGVNGVDDVQRDRLAAARALSDRFDAIVVLKGSGTVIAAPDHLPGINATGNAALATGGTGDVLAGWIAGEWAQRASRAPDTDGVETAWQACSAAVALHGAAAEAHPRQAVRALELVDAMRARRQAAAAA